jgi:molybdenum cofactor cytidylyltransferase
MKKQKIASVLLAAGGSARLGQPKQLVKLDGEALVRRAAVLLTGLEAGPVVAVVGCRPSEVAAEFEGLAVNVVVNDEWRQGMGSSIAQGVRNIPGEVDGVLLLLCDQWRVERADLLRLMHAWHADISAICVSEWRKEDSVFTGPPVIFPRELIHELKILQVDRGAKPVIDAYRHVKAVQMKNAAYDLDTPQELEGLINRSVRPRPRDPSPGAS